MYLGRIYDQDLLPVALQVEAIEARAKHPRIVDNVQQGIAHVKHNLNRDFIRSTVSVQDYIALSQRLSKLQSAH